MSLMLASVTHAAEAKTALAAGADVIDLKNPAVGALGALPPAVVAESVAAVGGQCLTSAALGEMLDESAAFVGAVAQMSASGVDAIKVGVRGVDISDSYLRSLVASGGRCALIAVLFADDGIPELGYIERLARAGFRGVMMDTAKKQQGGLRQSMPQRELSSFVATAGDSGLVCGLAGSLRSEDVAPLLRLGPDFLGFRGALCVGGGRSSPLDFSACRAIRKLVPLDARPSAALLSIQSRGCPTASAA